MTKGKQAEGLAKRLEHGFEWVLWSSRFVVLLGVIFGLAASVAVFIVGSVEIWGAIRDFFCEEGAKSSYLLATIIGAVDMYLIGVVLLIFSFGIYELFISHIDVGRSDCEVKILEIKDLDELKNKIIKVVIMVLVVTFFKKVLSTKYEGALEMLYFALSIFAVSFGVWFMHKKG